jgi:serine/threonine protein kinase
MTRVIGGDFRILESLSEGGMGAVFVAEQISTGKTRALKLMKPELANVPRFRERFVLEAKIGARIDSEHVVDVVGAGIDDASGSPWLAMELLEGEDLATMLTRRGPIPFAEVVEILRQLCHALAKAHAVGVVHRDLKPENIFIAKPRRDGIAFTLKVLDFGIAKLVSDATAPAAGGAAGTGALGTPLWMAPEQADAHGTITSATDIWPLGLIVYRLLSGRHYWLAAAGDRGLSVLLKEIILDPISSPSVRAASQLAAASALPAGFDGWFFRCVARDPSVRFASAQEAVQAFSSLGSAVAPFATTLPDVVPAAPADSALAATAAAPPSDSSSSSSPAAGLTPARVTEGNVAAGRAPSRRRPPFVPVIVVGGLFAILFAAWRLQPQPPAPIAPPVDAPPNLQGELAIIPVFAGDPSLGDTNPFQVATVFCGWTDLECARLSAIATAEGDTTKGLRVVYKHAVRADDEPGRLAAQALQGVYERGGAAALAKFREALFAHRAEITRANLLAWAREAGVSDTAELGKGLDERRWLPRVERDGDLAARFRISRSALYVDCREISSPADLRVAEAPGTTYRGRCAENARNGVTVSNRVAQPALSPFASPASDHAAKDTVYRFFAAPERRTRFGVVWVEIMPDASDVARRAAYVEGVVGPPERARYVQRTAQVVRDGAGWKVDREEEPQPFVPKTCLAQSVLSAATAPAVARSLLEPPSPSEARDGCIARIVNTWGCTRDRCVADVLCYRGTSVANVRRFELDPRAGKLREGESPFHDVAIEEASASAVRAACK